MPALENTLEELIPMSFRLYRENFLLDIKERLASLSTAI
jgi:hypothetical protein